MDIYTSQLKYSGGDRFDITVKGQDPIGKHFAPTWEMVKSIKNGTISQELYTLAYTGILSKSLATNPQVWQQIQNTYYQKRITLVCFCPPGTFCHRLILAGALQGMGWGEYKGEI
jgi:uncharacterized protein YeaO (DUF488 family)